MTKPSRSRRAASGPASAPAAAAEPAGTDVVIPINLEAVLWAVVIAVVLALRFISLDQLPLTTSESARAFSAWLVSEGTVPNEWPGDVTAALTSYLFRIFGSGEIVARIVPAVAGTALVASFWFAGRYVGRGVALLAGVLIALSPLAVHVSRSASGLAVGGLLSMVMVLSTLAYLERPRPLPAVVLASALGLSLASDPIATSTAIALLVFAAVETWRGEGAFSEAAATFRSNDEHWRPAVLALAITLVIGVAQFGTDVDRLSLAGPRQLGDMFSLPRDGLPWHYQPSLLIGYEWPLLLAGGLGYLAFLDRWLFSKSHELALVQRLLVVWATVALILVMFATQRESGQILLLLLPLSLLAAFMIEEASSSLDWDVLRRWWLAIVAALVLTSYALLQLTRWAQDGVTADEKVSTVLALAAVAAIVAIGSSYLGRNSPSLLLPLAAALALPFLVHSNLSLAFTDGTEFAADARLTASVEPLRAEVRRQTFEGGVPVAVDPRLRDTLGWPLRHEAIVFGDPPAGSPVIAPAGELLTGFVPLGATWLVAEGWVPDDFDPLPTWRWFTYRQPYGNLSRVEVQILGPTQ